MRVIRCVLVALVLAAAACDHSALSVEPDLARCAPGELCVRDGGAGLCDTRGACAFPLVTPDGGNCGIAGLACCGGGLCVMSTCGPANTCR